MFIDKDTLQRVNIFSQYKGRSSLNTPEIREELGVIEIPDPARGNDETEYTQEIDFPPYIIITQKSQEQLDQLHNRKLLDKIIQIELKSTRALREAALGSPSFLVKIEEEIQNLRKQLK